MLMGFGTVASLHSLHLPFQLCLPVLSHVGEFVHELDLNRHDRYLCIATLISSDKFSRLHMKSCQLDHGCTASEVKSMSQECFFYHRCSRLEDGTASVCCNDQWNPWLQVSQGVCVKLLRTSWTSNILKSTSANVILAYIGVCIDTYYM